MLQLPLSQWENLSAYREDRHPHLQAEPRPRPFLLLSVRPFFLTPKRDQILGLIRKHGSAAVVPNHVVGFFDFFFERHLRFDHGRGIGFQTMNRIESGYHGLEARAT